MSDYDSRPDTEAHARRVAQLMVGLIAEMAQRAAVHDWSKTQDPELATFNEYTPKLKNSTYGSDEYKGFLEGMGEGLAHHYAHNRHHPEHFENGVGDMTLVDVMEMLCDWKAATERHADGSLRKSLLIQQERFGFETQLAQVLWNTADQYGWIDPPKVTG